jgi:hypothetical protein
VHFERHRPSWLVSQADAIVSVFEWTEAIASCVNEKDSLMAALASDSQSILCGIELVHKQR